MFLVLGEKLFWVGGSWVEEDDLYLRGWFWHVVYVKIVGVELIVMGCVVPDESPEFYWGV